MPEVVALDPIRDANWIHLADLIGNPIFRELLLPPPFYEEKFLIVRSACENHADILLVHLEPSYRRDSSDPDRRGYGISLRERIDWTHGIDPSFGQIMADGAGIAPLSVVPASQRGLSFLEIDQKVPAATVDTIYSCLPIRSRLHLWMRA